MDEARLSAEKALLGRKVPSNAFMFMDTTELPDTVSSDVKEFLFSN